MQRSVDGVNVALSLDGRRLVWRIENRGKVDLAVSSPRDDAPVRAFLRVDGATLEIAKVEARAPKGGNVGEIPAHLKEIIGPGAVIAEELNLDQELREADPIRAAERRFASHQPTTYRDATITRARLRVEVGWMTSERKLLEKVGIVVPGFKRDELLEAIEEVDLGRAVAVKVYG